MIESKVSNRLTNQDLSTFFYAVKEYIACALSIYTIQKWRLIKKYALSVYNSRHVTVQQQAVLIVVTDKKLLRVDNWPWWWKMIEIPERGSHKDRTNFFEDFVRRILVTYQNCAYCKHRFALLLQDANSATDAPYVLMFKTIHLLLSPMFA